MTRDVDASWERRSERHVARRRPAVPSGRGDGRAPPNAADGAVTVPRVAGRRPLGPGPSASAACDVTSRVVVAVAGDVDVDGQLLQVVDVVLISCSAVCAQSFI